MAGQLREYMDEAGELVSRPQILPKEVRAFRPEVTPEELLDGVTLDKLHEIFRFVLQRQEDMVDPIRSTFGQIEKEPVSLPDKLDFVEVYTRKHRKVSFRTLLEKQKGRMQVVVTFLAVLELMKLGKIRAVQEEAFSDIELESLEDENETSLAGDAYRMEEALSGEESY